MRKKAGLLLAAASATVVLGVGAWALQRAQAAEEEALAAVETVSVRSLEGEVNKIAYDADGSEICLELVEGVWQSADNAAFPLTQSYAESMAGLAKTISATSLVLEHCDDFSDYGLNDPQKTISAETDSGESLTILIGDLNTHTGDYYLRIADDTALYTADATFFSTFDHTLLEMAALEDWPAADAVVTSISVSGGGNEYTVSSRTETSADEDGEETSLTIYTFTDSEESFDTTDAAADAVLSGASTLSFSAMAAFQPDSDTLAALGLGDTATRITVTYSQNEESSHLTLLVGDKQENGTYYVRLEDSDCVYTMEEDSLNLFLAFSGSFLPVYEG